MLNDSVPSDHTKNNCYNSNNQKNVNDVTHSETCKPEVADKPQNNKNYSNCIKKISHCDDIWLDIYDLYYALIKFKCQDAFHRIKPLNFPVFHIRRGLKLLLKQEVVENSTQNDLLSQYMLTDFVNRLRFIWLPLVEGVYT